MKSNDIKFQVQEQENDFMYLVNIYVPKGRANFIISPNAFYLS